MSVIKRALQGLDEAVDRLDDAVRGYEETQRGKQRDLFDAFSGTSGEVSTEEQPQAAAENVVVFDPQFFAARLDRAIDRVERILGEKGASAHG